jgi:hypothetical protein
MTPLSFKEIRICLTSGVMDTADFNLATHLNVITSAIAAHTPLIA